MYAKYVLGSPPYSSLNSIQPVDTPTIPMSSPRSVQSRPLRAVTSMLNVYVAPGTSFFTSVHISRSAAAFDLVHPAISPLSALSYSRIMHDCPSQWRTIESCPLGSFESPAFHGSAHGLAAEPSLFWNRPRQPSSHTPIMRVLPTSHAAQLPPQSTPPSSPFMSRSVHVAPPSVASQSASPSPSPS